MKFDITELLIVFDELLTPHPLMKNKVYIGLEQLVKCSEIKVLDEKKKNLEIIHDGQSGMCFLQLTGDNILSYDE